MTHFDCCFVHDTCDTRPSLQLNYDAIIIELLLSRCRRTRIKSIELTPCMCMFSTKYYYYGTVNYFGLGNQCIYYYAPGNNKSHNYIRRDPSTEFSGWKYYKEIRHLYNMWIAFVFRISSRKWSINIKKIEVLNMKLNQ